MPLDLAPEAAGLSAAIAALTATVGQAVQHWAGAAKRDERHRDAVALRDEIGKLAARVDALNLAGVRAESDRERLREGLDRLDREVVTVRDRLERQGHAVEADLRPMRDGIASMQALLRGAGDR